MQGEIISSSRVLHHYREHDVVSLPWEPYLNSDTIIWPATFGAKFHAPFCYVVPLTAFSTTSCGLVAQISTQGYQIEES